LKGDDFMRVCIDAGHGGRQPGACANDLVEKDITLDLALRAKQHLERNGIDVVMIRETDVDIDLNTRPRIANNADCDLFVSLHVNAGGGEGIGIWHSICDGYGVGGNKRANLILPELLNTGMGNYGIHTRRGDDGRDYYCVIRETAMPAIIVEHGFIDNDGDAKLLTQDDIREHLAEGDAKGICAYFGIDYQPVAFEVMYTVVSGDTLWGISRRYDTTVDDIKSLNGLTSNTIYPGQQLRVK
jgi:N-acetylmuramoyl-L-alanine amidase